MDKFNLKTACFKKTLHLDDDMGTLAKNITDNWLIGIRETNPAILDMFHERDRKPYRDLLPWSGEFAGKYITGAYYMYQINHEDALRRYVMGFLEELLTCIDEDGYVGCYQQECHLTGAYSQTPSVTGATWDAWAHYHIMIGLYLWHRETQDSRLWEALLRIAELFLKTFYRGGRRLADIGSTEMNLAPLHIFVLLYQDTGDERYRTFAQEIEKDLILPIAGNYMEHALSGLEFYQCPKPRWESLHVIMGIASMYGATGEDTYRQAAEQIFYSILKTDVHNTGAFSTEEQAVGNPFVNGNIELCCVIAYNALACDVLKMTGDPRIADFLELSLYNAVMGSFSPTGRWSTYNTPMEGIKAANYQSIVFQSRPGSPDLNCCSVNAARGIGMLSEWAVMENDDTVYLHYFGAGSCKTAGGLDILVEGDYPVSGKVSITLRSAKNQRVAIRIPAWSAQTMIVLDGIEEHPVSGGYWITERTWNGETINLLFDFTPYLFEGGGDYAGKQSIYAGPVLYGYDLSMDDHLDFDHLPIIARRSLKNAVPERLENGRIVMKLPNGMTLSNFYHLGSTGSVYKTWFVCN